MGDDPTSHPPDDESSSEPPPETHQVSASAGVPVESQQSVGRSLSLSYEVLQSVAASLDLPYEVVQEAVAELAALRSEELEEVRSILQRARDAGAEAIASLTDLIHRVRGSNAAAVMTRSLDNASRIDTAIRLIELILRQLQ